MIRLASIISRIERHMEKAEELSKKNLTNEIIFSALAMECFQCVNSAIELGELIVSKKNLGFPSRYVEIFELLLESEIIDEETFNCIRRLIFLRNLISHEYYKIKKSELKEMADLLKCLKKLIKEAKKLSKKS